jgi:hypothetical protein
MSGSSIAVVANALRLRRGSRDRRRGEATRQTRRRALAVEAAE